MSSILTNMSSMSAVQNLDATQANLATVQSQISSGLKVGSAQDNAAYFSIATSLRTSVSNLSAVSDSLHLGTSVVNTATAALTNTTSILQKMQAALVSAQQPGTDKAAIGVSLKALQAQLSSSVSSASFNNVNALDGSTVTTANGGSGGSGASGNLSIVSGVTGTGAKTTIATISVDTAATNFGTGTGSLFLTQGANNATTNPPVNATTETLVDVTGSSSGSDLTSKATARGTADGLTADAVNLVVDDNTTTDQLTSFITAVGAALDNVNKAAENLGAAQSNISLQSTFISSLSDSITTGIGSLVDADMNQASTKLSALQTQQQLGVQALSVANQNSQLILKLFGG